MNKTLLRIKFLAGALLLPGLFASAQVPGGADVNSALVKLFADVPAFSVKATVQVLNSNRVETLRVPGSFMCLDGKLRLDIDMGQLKLNNAGQNAATIVAYYKQVGLDHVSSVLRPDKKATYIIYPGVQAYVTIPLTNQDSAIANQKVVRTALARETIDGHVCTKNRSVVQNQKGKTLLEAITWNAADLQNFPLRIETRENGKTGVMHFQPPSFARPDPKVFEPPAGYKQYRDEQDLLMAAVAKATTVRKK